MEQQWEESEKILELECTGITALNIAAQTITAGR